MDNIKIKAQKLMNDNLIIHKPIAWQKHQEKQINDYWDINGKEVVRRKLINLYSDINEERKLQSCINPIQSYLLEPLILETEKLISELKSI
jgi:hypothetical protein